MCTAVPILPLQSVNSLLSGTPQREGLEAHPPPPNHFSAKIKINLTKNNLTKITEPKIAKNR